MKQCVLIPKLTKDMFYISKNTDHNAAHAAAEQDHTKAI